MTRSRAKLVAHAPGHALTVEKDYGKSFRSHTGSADWKLTCSCGWVYSRWCYGPGDATGPANRHIAKEG